MKGSRDAGKGNSWEIVTGVSLVRSAVQGRGATGWRETSESEGREVAERRLTAWCQARQKEIDLGKREGKEMEAAGALWGKCRFSFVYASAAQHPRPDTPPSKGDVAGWAIYSKAPANSCRQPANLFLNVCLGKAKALAVY